MNQYGVLIVACLVTATAGAQTTAKRYTAFPDSIATHRVVLDADHKIVSWIKPQNKAYDQFLRQRWAFILKGIPNSPGPAPRSNYPQYYFYCAYKDQQMIPDTWMNDIGERIPNWFESARLYYQYTGDMRPMQIVQGLVEYAIEHGTSAAGSDWPLFPFTTADAGDTLFRGFTTGRVNSLVLHEVQVDHAGDMGFTYYRLFEMTGIEKFRQAAIHVADALASHAVEGSASRSVWPYRVVTDDGRITAPYGANWAGAYSLLATLVKAGTGNVKGYTAAMEKARNFVLKFPMQTGYWTDGHTDTDIRGTTYRSNMSASNTTLYLLDHPEFDPEQRKHIPELIKWTEQYFVDRTVPGEPANQWGANIVGEQDSFLVKMDYQTARYGAECARWYAISGDAAYKEKAFRALNWVTYCSDSNGMAFESPLSHGITSWWSDCYGEGPRMFYHAMAAIPDWAPVNENHILYSEAVLKQVSYAPHRIGYHAAEDGTDYLKLSFKPSAVSLNGQSIPASATAGEYYTVKKLADGGYHLIIRRQHAGSIDIQ